MIASLPMYLRTENKDAHNRYWQLIRDHLTSNGFDVPNTLSSGEDIAFWQRSDLVFSQTCGMPYRLYLHDQVQLIGTPDYGLNDCPAGHYNSVIIKHIDDPRENLTDFADSPIAVNAKISQSGYAAPQSEAEKAGFQFRNLVLSGGHVLSANKVATGQADIAAIDAVTWRNILRYDSFANNLKILTSTDPTPGLPYICGASVDKDAVATAISHAIEEIADQDRAELGIKSLIAIPKSDYLAIKNP